MEYRRSRSSICPNHKIIIITRTVSGNIPAIRDAGDLARAMAALAGAAATRAITPGEAAQSAQVVDAYIRAVEMTDIERRLRVVEAAGAPRD